MANKLSINDLKSPEHYTGKPVYKDIKWVSNGEEYEAGVYVRKLSYNDAVNGALLRSDAAKNKEDITLEKVLIEQIAKCICNEKGDPVFTAADITGESDPEKGPISQGLFIALTNVVGEVNGATVKTKSPQPKKTSGTN